VYHFKNPRYQLVRQSGEIGDRLFQITFTGIGARAYVFTSAEAPLCAIRRGDGALPGVT
jgi:hypothetical protein